MNYNLILSVYSISHTQYIYEQNRVDVQLNKSNTTISNICVFFSSLYDMFPPAKISILCFYIGLAMYQKTVITFYIHIGAFGWEYQKVVLEALLIFIILTNINMEMKLSLRWELHTEPKVLHLCPPISLSPQSIKAGNLN